MSSEARIQQRILGGREEIAGTPALAQLFLLDRTARGWRNPVSLLNLGASMMGGQIAALGLKAAALSAPDTRPGAVHILFLSAPDPNAPCDILVEPMRDGRRLSHRLTRITQGDKLRAQVTTALATPALADGGPDYSCAIPPPTMPDPDTLPTRAERLPGVPTGSIEAMILTGFPFLDIRFVASSEPTQDGCSYFWVRVPDAGGMDAIDHYGLLTVISDFWCALPVHQLASARAAMGENFVTTSLDHALWFEAEPDCAQWMLVEMRVLAVGRSVSTMQSRIWTRDGQPLANCTQQCLLVPSIA